MTTLNQEQAERLDALLTQDERIIWTGRPVRDRASNNLPLFALGLLVMTILAAVVIYEALLAIWNGAPTLSDIFAASLLLLPAGAGILIYRWRRQHMQIVYALTDQRAIILEPKKHEAFEIAKLRNLSVELSGNDTGDLFFEHKLHWDTEDGYETRKNGFVGIPSVKAVERELLRTWKRIDSSMILPLLSIRKRAAHEIEPELLADETLLWSEKPQAARLSFGILKIAWSLVLSAFLLYGLLSLVAAFADSPPHHVVGSWIFAAILGLWVIHTITGPFRSYFALKRVCFAITDRRVMLLSKRETGSVSLHALNIKRINHRLGRSGDIIFELNEPLLIEDENITVSFIGIKHVDDIADLLRELLQKQKPQSDRY